MSTAFVVAFGVAALLLLACHSWINERQMEPYMDELFHTPQAAEFCSSVLDHRVPSYDPAITTLPGLYLVPTLLCVVSRASFAVSSRALRLSSLFFSLASLPLIFAILLKLRIRIGLPARNLDNLAIIALVLWLHPVSLFYSHLFYTDTPATLYIMFCWLFALSNWQVASSLAGILASLTRQTHLVWHMFIVFDAFSHDLLYGSSLLQVSPTQVFQALFRLWPHISAGLVYMVFLFFNGGPAVGDREHHEMSLHFAMLPYFLGFHTLSLLPFHALSHKSFFRQLRVVLREGRILAMFVLTCCGLAILVIATGDRVHPFILADNRHFTFYLYRKWLLKSSARRLCLLPLYGWGIVGTFVEFRTQLQEFDSDENKKGRSSVFSKRIILVEQAGDVVLLFCAAVTLVPSPLMEPRYFCIASVFLSIRRIARTPKHPSMFKLILLSVFLALVNILFVYIFAELSFERPVDSHMPHDHSPGRFMF